jgi:hypothetical protein
VQVIILGDLHFGIKKFSLDFFENQMNFFDNQLFPYMINNGIRTIIQTGDFFDNRSNIDINFLHIFRKRFMDKLVELDITLITYLGNHCIYFKNTMVVNSSSILAELYPNNFRVIDTQQILDIGSKQFGFVPWLLPDATIDDKLLKQSDYVFGHLELSGFEISKGVVDTHSKLSCSSFVEYKNIKIIFSGHYHIRNMTKLVKYVGIPYQCTWNDYTNSTGFHILDTTTDALEFVENIRSKVYSKILYNGTIIMDDITISKEELTKILFEKPNLIVKLYLYNLPLTEPIKDIIEILDQSTISYTIIDNRSEQESIQESTELTAKVQLKTTDSFINDFIKEYHPELYDIYLALIDKDYNE